MAIAATDLLIKLAVNLTPGDTNAQTNPTSSLGGYMSSTLYGQTTVGGTAMAVGDTTVTVTNGSLNFPATGNFNIQIDLEIMTVTAGQGTNTWTITRGVSGTVAATHAAGAVVESPAHLFDDLTGDENAASNADYRCLFIHNNHATLTLQNAVLWATSTGNAATIKSLAVDPTAASAHNQAGTIQTVAVPANEDTAPAGVTFTLASVANAKATGLSLGNIAPGQCKAFWLKRAGTNSGAVNGDSLAWQIQGDTAA